MTRPRVVGTAAALALLLSGCSSEHSGAANQPAGTDGGAGGSGGAPPELGAPLDAPTDESWVWIPIEGTQCADGTEAGVGVNFTTQSKNLVVWFQGNGVCYDLTSCTLFQSELTGMGPDPLNHLWWGDPNTDHLGLFDRSDPTNPFRRDNFVAFPHCGVDGHTADKESTYPPLPTVHQHGYSNVTTAIPRILATFQDATRVIVTGFSAGGIGAAANYDHIAKGFEALGMPPPFLIVDAGPILRPPYAGPNATAALRNGWGLENTIDTWCDTCAEEGYHAGYQELLQKHKGLRSAIVSSYNDNVATPLYLLLNGSAFDGARFEEGLRDLATWTEGLLPDVAPSVHHEFYYPGARHGALVVAPLPSTTGLEDFLNAQLNGDSSWATIEQ